MTGEEALSGAKAELHCHSDGVLDAAMVRTLHPAEPGTALATELADCYPVNSVENWATGYNRLLSKFLGEHQERLENVILNHVERWRRQNTRYAELFVSRVTLGIADEGALIEWFRSLRARLDARQQAPRVNLLSCIGRGPMERMAQQSERICKLGALGLITGVSYAGNELATTVRENRRFFDRFHEQGLGIEIHAGELGGPESVRDALDFGHPKRLGHGIRAFEDEALVDRLAQDNIHLEFCPTSNMRLGVVASAAQLPIRKALTAGIAFSINTDDPGVFDCSLASELALVRDTFELSREEIERIYSCAIKAAFGPVSVSEAGELRE